MYTHIASSNQAQLDEAIQVHLPTHPYLSMCFSTTFCCYRPKGRQPCIQDQPSVMGADILNNPQNNYYGRSSNYPERIQLSPMHQLGEFRCSFEFKLCSSILVVHVCKQWPMKRHVSR